MNSERPSPDISEAMAEELIEVLRRDEVLVQFTDRWRDLSKLAQIAAARAWLRLALGTR